MISNVQKLSNIKDIDQQFEDMLYTKDDPGRYEGHVVHEGWPGALLGACCTRRMARGVMRGMLYTKDGPGRYEGP